MIDKLKAFAVKVLKDPAAFLRSTLTTALAVAAVVAAVTAVGAPIPAEWTVYLAAGVTALRQAIAFFDSKNTSFGRGA